MNIHDLACPKPHISTSNVDEIFMFFQEPLLDPFFSIFWRLGAKMLDFGSPLPPSWAKSGAQNRPIGAKVASKNFGGCSLFEVLEASLCLDRFRYAPGYHFCRLWIDLSWFLIDVGIMLVQSSMHFWRQICKPLKPYVTTILATQREYNYPQRR